MYHLQRLNYYTQYSLFKTQLKQNDNFDPGNKTVTQKKEDVPVPI